MPASDRLHLVSHPLCPYVQRAVIVATEKGVAFTRTDIDLSAKPDWFLKISPTGKTPLLEVRRPSGERHVIFESAVICEYLDETSDAPLLPHDPLTRAQARAWIEFASATLADIAGFYGAADEAAFEAKQATLRGRFARLETAVQGPWFAGEAFGLPDAAFGPVFRYLDAFEELAGVELAEGLPKVADWRAALAARASVRDAAVADYPQRLAAFLRARPSAVLAARIAAAASS